MSTETLPLPVETAADPFYIGYRYVKSAGPGGREAVPLSIEDFLHPQEEDRFMLTDGHARAVHYLRDAIQIAAESRPDVRVFTEHRVDWQVPGILPHGPDVVAFDHFLADWDPLKGTLPVRDLGAGVMAVVEVTSESTRATDFEAKFLEYHAAGIPYYVILDAAGPPGGERVLAFRRAAEEYRPLPRDPQLGVFVPRINLWLRWEGDTVVAATEAGRDIPTNVERERLLQSERERADAERLRADAERLRADAERLRADAERLRADELARELASLKARLNGTE